MTWWQDEIQQLRQENEQLRQQLANQLSFSQLIEQYLKEKKLADKSATNTSLSEGGELLQFKAWVEQRVIRSRNRNSDSINLCKDDNYY